MRIKVRFGLGFGHEWSALELGRAWALWVASLCVVTADGMQAYRCHSTTRRTQKRKFRTTVGLVWFVRVLCVPYMVNGA